MPPRLSMIASSNFLMRLLLDQGLPRSTVRLLRRSGVDVVHTGDIGLATAEDRAILEYAREDHRIVVTLDADFHALLAWSEATEPSVIRIRIQGLRAEALSKLLLNVIEAWGQDLRRGCAMTVQRDQVRFRYLPLAARPRPERR